MPNESGMEYGGEFDSRESKSAPRSSDCYGDIVSDSMRHPLQPLFVDDQGTVRFKANAIVRFLLDAGPFDMNKLAMMSWSNEDRTQFAQLIGYSLSGFGELSYVSDETFAAAEEERLKHDRRCRVLAARKTTKTTGRP